MASIGRRLAALQTDYIEMRTKYTAIQTQDDALLEQLTKNFAQTSELPRL